MIEGTTRTIKKTNETAMALSRRREALCELTNADLRQVAAHP